MKLLYICANNLNDDSGVSKKVRGQIKAMEKRGIKVSSAFWGEKNIYVGESSVKKMSKLSYLGFWINLRNLYIEAFKYIKKNNIGKVYIRYSILDRNLRFFLKNLYADQIDVYMEFPTFPYEDEIKNKPLFKRFTLYIDRIFRKDLKKYVKYAFTPSIVKGNKIYGIPTLRFDNALDPDFVEPRTSYRKIDGVYRLIGVGNVSPWHGYDRVIKGIYEYFERGNKDEILFNIVGEGPEISNLKQMTKKLNLEDKIVFHGAQYGKELDQLYSNADIGVASLGLHRYNIKNFSSIKSREYCFKSLPFLSLKGKDEDFKDNFPYVISVDLADNPINIKGVITKFNYMNPRKYIGYMRRYADMNLSWDSKFADVIKRIKE